MQTPEKWSLVLMTSLLLGFGAMTWYLQLREPLEVDAGVLAHIPFQIGPWQGRDVEMESGVEEMLDADFNIQRVYFHPVGDLVWLYVGYYGTQRGGRPEHAPGECYPSSGWEILEREIVRVSSHRGEANEFVVEKSGNRRLVHFWYRSSRSNGMLSILDQSVDHLISRIRDGRADGSLVRLSTTIEDGRESEARSRLISFGRDLEPLLEEYWPTEAPRGSASGVATSISGRSP